MGIDVELYSNLLSCLNVVLLDAIFSKDAEDHFSRILSWHFKDIFLTHPCVTRSGRNTTLCL